MNKEYVSIIVRETGLRENQVENTLKLLENGATIPFISRYRKESTGGMDEVQVTEVSDALERLEALAKRKETIIGTIVIGNFACSDFRKVKCPVLRG